jgi:hypothetical protein
MIQTNFVSLSGDEAPTHVVPSSRCGFAHVAGEVVLTARICHSSSQQRRSRAVVQADRHVRDRVLAGILNSILICVDPHAIPNLYWGLIAENFDVAHGTGLPERDGRIIAS